MPLYELYGLAKAKLHSEEINTACAPDQSSEPESDFFELVWENGQISMQGQSSRARKSPISRSLPSHCLPSQSPNCRDRDAGHGGNTRMGKFGDLDSGLNDIPMSVPSGEVDLSLEEDIIPWFNYSIDGSLQHDYSTDLLHEVSGVTGNDLPASNSFPLMDKRNSFNQILRDSHKNSVSVRDVPNSEQGNVSKGSSAGEVETITAKASTSQLYTPFSQQCQTSFTSVRSRVSENNCGEITQIPPSSSDFSGLKMQKQDSTTPCNGSFIMNFSHFARPAALVRANLQSIGLMAGSSARSENMGNKKKDTVGTSSNPTESTLIDSRGECLKESTRYCQQPMETSKADLKPLESKSLERKSAASKQSDPVCKEDVFKTDQTSNLVVAESSLKGQTAAGKNMEPVVTSSSMCSGNGMDRGSDDGNQNLKRKSRDAEESDCHSEDNEEESVDAKKVTPVRPKRSRAAEVHNLSERRRRDRINEKMRALQELIPNCNKVDKASMLDEAIEYLKTLQLQVQIMSMGAGLYMPQMMFPPGMHAPHMTPFLPMGVGMQMGLGMGYGMGMPDISGGSSRFPMMQVPQMQGTHLPVPPMPGHTALHGMPRSNPQGFAFPGQGFSMPMPQVPPVYFSGGPLMNNTVLGLNACGAAGLMGNVDSVSPSGSKDPPPNLNTQVMQTTVGNNSTTQMPNQCEATNVGCEQSSLAHNNGHASNVNGSEVVNPGKDDKPVIGKSCE
ncbi:hypothetical protein L6164_034904 [Bauhinia variegata]|uniref:Uncharacterized protein n=1 Tax=Bauhinia variegata TaxID=167791 RepID=A0ACB9KW49_BAUVA|nr:hypothetical protein L6164_034904 [Bauhinia variegata]